MFGIGLQEFLLVCVFALLILGPKRLPSALRSLGLLQRRIGSAYRSLRWELERQVDLGDEENQNSLTDTENQPNSAPPATAATLQKKARKKARRRVPRQEKKPPDTDTS